jgi:hypothetical protein
LLDAGTCFISDARLARFDLRTPKKQLTPAWCNELNGAVCQTPVAVGQTIFLVRHADGLPGVVVSALSADKGQPYWHTHLAAPLAAEPAVDKGGNVTAVSAAGGVFQLTPDVLTGQASAEPAVAPPVVGPRRPVTGVARFDGGRLALTCSADDEVAAFDPGDRPAALRAWRLPGRLSCPAIAWGGGLVAPADVGQVFFCEPLSGKKLSEPFQPPLRPGALPAWREPAVAGDKELIISDGRTKLYRLRLVEKPATHFEAAAEEELAQPIVSPLAVVGKLVCGVDAADQLAFFDLAELDRTEEHALAGRCTWGPRTVGNRVMLATDAGQLYCFDGSGKLAWQVELPYGPLAGNPLPVADHLFLAARSGVVWRVDAKTGKELGKVDAGQPLGTGPVLLGDRLLVGGHDGSLYQLAPP